jgi:hypothetical protein
VLISTGRELPACGPVLVNTTAEGGMARYQDPVKRPVICSEEWFKEKGFEVSYFPLPGVIENYGKKAWASMWTVQSMRREPSLSNKIALL